MIFRSKLLAISKKLRHVNKLLYSTIQLPKNDISKIRNIGIGAHIDAGKTTTTERMLYYSGVIDYMGEVHHGNTFTDYMEQERERGITITSATVTFFWKNYQFNLIDTPGHIDFTMEVEQTLNVLDGAVVILDGSAGVEAQTLTVWRQADRYQIPRIVYVNKMDRPDADVKACCDSILQKLEVSPILLQLPVVEEGKFIGIIDLLSQDLIVYEGPKNREMRRIPLTEKDHPKWHSEAQRARLKVIEQLSDYNDELANKVIASESFDSISNDEVVAALRTVTSNRRAVPVLLGSSYKNIGVQSLMDAMVLYLPSPARSNALFSAFEDNFCGRAFKVKHDNQRGPLVFTRIYNGSIKKGQRIFSVQQDHSEQVGRVYVAYADDFREVDSLGSGNIAVLSGLKKVMSGDLIVGSQTAYDKARKNASKKTEGADVDALFGVGAKVPEPVFFCSIEPPSMAFQGALDIALTELQREDPSLRVSFNSDTGQTVLAGMGELHLEIIKDRILKEYKVEADLGPLQIAYREAPIELKKDTLTVDTRIGNHKNHVSVTLSLIPDESAPTAPKLKFDKNPDNASNIAGILPKHINAITKGVHVGLALGPKINSQVINTNVMLHWFEIGKGTSDTIIASAVTRLTQKLLREAGTNVLEPVMLLEVVAPSEYVSVIMSDLSRRRTIIENVTVRGNSKTIIGRTPLSELLGYSTDLRTITSGTATFTMEFLQYQKMTSDQEESAIRAVRGF